MQPPGVVVVVVGQNNGLNITCRINPNSLQPESNLLDRGNLDLDHLREERVPPGQVAWRRILSRVAGVDDEFPFGMLNQPGEHGQRTGPYLVAKNVDLATE